MSQNRNFSATFYPSLQYSNMKATGMRKTSSDRSARGRSLAPLGAEALRQQLTVKPELQKNQSISQQQGKRSQSSRRRTKTVYERQPKSAHKRNQPMFTIALMQPRQHVNEQALKMQEKRRSKINEQAQHMFLDVQRAVKANVICNAHERTSRSAQHISQKADETMSKIDIAIVENKNMQREFFSARRKIAQAAVSVSKNHSIGMKLLDYDSDEEKSQYYSGASTRSTQFSNLSASSVKNAQENQRRNSSCILQRKKLGNCPKVWSIANDFKKGRQFMAMPSIRVTEMN